MSRSEDLQHRKWREYSKKYYEANGGPKALMGNVPKLAEGAVNPMWATTESVKEVASIVAPILRTREPKKKAKREMIATPYGYFMKDPIEIEEIDEDLA